eukprot:scaffold257_cov400-Pavlova_lutheri.AAC.6
MARVSESGAAAGCRCSSIGKSVRLNQSMVPVCLRVYDRRRPILGVDLIGPLRKLHGAAPGDAKVTWMGSHTIFQMAERSVYSKVLYCLSTPPCDCEWYGVPVTCRTPNAAQNALNRVRYAGPLSV